MNSCQDSELGVENVIQTFHNYGILVTERVTEEWLNGDENDVGYQEVSDDY